MSPCMGVFDKQTKAKLGMFEKQNQLFGNRTKTVQTCERDKNKRKCKLI